MHRTVLNPIFKYGATARAWSDYSVTAILHYSNYTSNDRIPWRTQVDQSSDFPIQNSEHVVVLMNHLHLALYDRPVRGPTTKQRLKIPRCASTRAPIVATWADRFSWCFWRRFSRFLACPLTLPTGGVPPCLSVIVHLCSSRRCCLATDAATPELQ